MKGNRTKIKVGILIAALSLVIAAAAPQCNEWTLKVTALDGAEPGPVWIQLEDKLCVDECTALHTSVVPMNRFESEFSEWLGDEGCIDALDFDSDTDIQCEAVFKPFKETYWVRDVYKKGYGELSEFSHFPDDGIGTYKIGSYYTTAIIPGTDGGYVMVGGLIDEINGHQGWIAKFNAHGELVWEHEYGQIGHDTFKAIHETKDGGYIVVGATAQETNMVPNGVVKYNPWMLKLDVAGNLLWQSIWRAQGVFWSVDQTKFGDATTNGEYIAAGWVAGTLSVDEDLYHAFVVRVDRNGAAKWHNTYGDPNTSQLVNSIRERPDGRIILFGEASLPKSATRGGTAPLNRDLWLLNLSNNGSIAGETTFGTPNGMTEIATAAHQGIAPLSDGNYLLLGTSKDELSNNSLLTAIWVDEAGSFKWGYQYDTYFSGTTAFAAKQFPAGHIGLAIDRTAALGNTALKPGLLLTDGSGNLFDQGFTFSMQNNYWAQDRAWTGEIFSTNGGYLVGGTARHNDRSIVWLAKTNEEYDPSVPEGANNYSCPRYFSSSNTNPEQQELIPVQGKVKPERLEFKGQVMHNSSLVPDTPSSIVGNLCDCSLHCSSGTCNAYCNNYGSASCMGTSHCTLVAEPTSSTVLNPYTDDTTLECQLSATCDALILAKTRAYCRHDATCRVSMNNGELNCEDSATCTLACRPYEDKSCTMKCGSSETNDCTLLCMPDGVEAETIKVTDEATCSAIP